AYRRDTGTPLPARYHLEGPYLRYTLLEATAGPFVLDPLVVFSTYSGSYSDNWGFTATYDLQGNAFAGGNVNDNVWNPNPGNVYFPVTPGAVQGTFGGGILYSSNQPIFWSTDMALWKTNPTGTTRLWATYLGGTNNEQPHSLVTDPQGNLYVLGATRSTDFPTTPTAYQPASAGGIDILVACLSANGSQLLASTYLGGSGEDGLNSRTYPLYYFYADDGRGEIFLSDTACYLISTSRSVDFPTTPNAYQSVRRGGMDAVLVKLSLDLSQVYASTYLGGSGADAGYAIRIGFGGVVYAAGGTTSSDFPTTSGAYQPTYQGGRADGWLAILSPDLDQLLIGTYWGTPAYDQVFMIDLDRQGFLWGAGHTESAALAPTPGAYGTPGGKHFVFSMNDSLSQVTRLAVWGGQSRATPNITISAFAADRCGYVYVAGWGGLNIGSGPIGSTFGLPTTPNANQTTTDGADFYVAAFEPGLTGLAYASFWGGSSADEHVDGGTSRFDNRGIIYQSVCGGCGGYSDFPTTPGALSATNNSPNCNNALFKIDFELGEPVVAALALIPPSGCAPFTTTPQNLSQNALRYYWDFGNGQTSTAANPPPVTYSAPGTYTLTLVAENLFTCNQRDTLRRTIRVYPPPQAAFSFEPHCDLTVSFSAADTSPGLYIWDFGDGERDTARQTSHTYRAAGTYTVQLIVQSPQGCRDTTQQTLSVAPSPVQASFTWIGDTCQGRFTFLNQSQNAVQYTWVLGTGDTLNEPSPTYTFPASGTYPVTLIAYDSAGCADTLTQLVPVSRVVTAAFAPQIDFCALTVQLQNQSTGAAHYLWFFGDGDTSRSPAPTHTYAAPGTYVIVLVARSPDSLCADTTSLEIEIDYRSQAQAWVRVDTCSWRVTFISRSRFDNGVEWSLPDGTLQRGDTVFWTAPAPGTYVYQLRTNPDGSPICQDTLIGSVHIPARQGLDSLLWEADLCARTIAFQVPWPRDRILGLQTEGFTYPPGTSQVVLPLLSGHTYRLEVIYLDREGCRDTLSYELTSDEAVKKALFIPNVFTPNGDGVNDVFRVVGSEACVQELAIYDRWGRELYVTRTAPFVWDGRVKGGEPAAEGAYVYVIRFAGFVRAGTVTLVR
ncbi:MAG: PKD domain-containing protein, partial [Bacteroidetes bacterium]